MGIFNLQFLEQYTGTEFAAKEYLLYQNSKNYVFRRC